MQENRPDRYWAEVERSESVARVRAGGELDMASAPGLQRALETAFQEGILVVGLDLSEVTFFDSTGLRTVLEAYERAAERRHALVVADASAAVTKILEVTRTQHLLDVVRRPEIARVLEEAESVGWRPIPVSAPREN